MLKFFWKYCSVRTKKLHKMKLKKFFFDTWKKIMIFKLELSPQSFHYDVFNPLYSVCMYYESSPLTSGSNCQKHIVDTPRKRMDDAFVWLPRTVCYAMCSLWIDPYVICRANEKLECMWCKGGSLYLIFPVIVNTHSHSNIGNRKRLALLYPCQSNKTVLFQ